MNFRQLRYFLSVVETGNMTRAADQLHVAQTALGMQIKQLEESLGVALLVRHSRGVEPTAAGTLLRDRAIEILKLVEQTRREVAAGSESRDRIHSPRHHTGADAGRRHRDRDGGARAARGRFAESGRGHEPCPDRNARARRDRLHPVLRRSGPAAGRPHSASSGRPRPGHAARESHAPADRFCRHAGSRPRHAGRRRHGPQRRGHGRRAR